MKMARETRPMVIAVAATTIPPIIEATAEAPVARAMTRYITPARNPGITALVIDVSSVQSCPFPPMAGGTFR
jgi:hypothetical protein